MIVLVQSGFGISVLPDLFVPPDSPLVRIPLEGIEPISFGLYYKSLQGNEPLRAARGLGGFGIACRFYPVRREDKRA